MGPMENIGNSEKGSQNLRPEKWVSRRCPEHLLFEYGPLVFSSQPIVKCTTARVSETT